MQTAVEVARWRLLPGKPYRKMERLIKWSWMNALTQQKRKKSKKIRKEVTLMTININDLKNMTAADLRKIESAISEERRIAVRCALKEMARILKKDGPMPASVAAGLVGMTLGQVRHPDNFHRLIDAGVKYFKETKTKTFTCLEDGETITVTRKIPMVRAAE